MPKSKGKRVSISKKVLKQMQLSSRLSALENSLQSLMQSKQNEAQFHIGVMFGVNALVELLESKGVITLKELEAARIKVIEEYRQEKIEEAKREATAKRHNDNPIHYDSTTDKWFVYAPNWLDKIGPFLTEAAAQTALDTVRSLGPAVDQLGEAQRDTTSQQGMEPDHTDPLPLPAPAAPAPERVSVPCPEVR